MDIKDRVKKLRKAKGLDQSELGTLIGLSLKTISTIETGRSDPSTKQLKALSDFFNVSIDYLVTGTETEKTISEEENEIIKIVRESPEIRELMKETVALKKKVINKLWQVTNKNRGGYANAA
jgi:transcriptional regulator with XRE-family HTH domain